MNRVFLLSLVLVAAVAGSPARAAADQWWFGGGIGLGFGDFTFVTIEPIVGYNATDRLSVGGGLIFRYRTDDRFSPSFDSTDYGGSGFSRFRVVKPLFLQAEYQYLSYEFVRPGGTTDRDGYNSLLGGAGYSRSLGHRTSFFTTLLYNFLYDDNELSPYDDPWIIRVGVGFSF